MTKLLTHAHDRRNHPLYSRTLSWSYFTMSSSSTLLSQQVRPAESTPQSHTIPEGILLGGPSDLEVVEILQDLIDPVEETRNVNSPALAWYKRPSPAWYAEALEENSKPNTILQATLWNSHRRDIHELYPCSSRRSVH